MQLKTEASEQKKRGAYYTPSKLSDFLVRTFCLSSKFKNILEPSCGDGVFLDSFIKNDERIKDRDFTAIEIEANVAKDLKAKVSKHKNIKVLCEDFIDFYNENNSKKSYDLIIGNPPYVRFQYLTENQRKLHNENLIKNDMKSNKLINLWVSFFVASENLLDQSNGKLIFIIPAELLQVAYAKELRLFLSTKFARIILLAFNELIFEGIQQEVLVFIGEKGTASKCEIGLAQYENVDDLCKNYSESIQYKILSHSQTKWTSYILNKEVLDEIEKIKNNNLFLKFDDIAKINVGITTGNNAYFCVDDNEISKYDLENVVLPLIGKSSHAKGAFFTSSDWQDNKAQGKKASLIVFPDKPFEQYPEGNRKYIESGEETDQHIGYKCSIRNKWYIVPSIWKPDAFVLRRNNNFPKFVLNECGAVSTDTMHRVKFNDGYDKYKMLLSYYNSISFAFTEICARSYGGGVLEILPRELGSVYLPDLREFDTKRTKVLLDEIDTELRENGYGNFEVLLDKLDKEILIDYMDMSYDVCQQFRTAWKQMMKKRKIRGKKR